MKQYPQIPPVEEAPELPDAGHLWIQEQVDGALLRFRLQPSGVLQFGDRTRAYETATDVPLPYQHAVRHVQTALNREILRGAVENPSEIVFFGEAMHQQRLDYDWDRTPSFLGFDVWSPDGGFRPPGAAEQIFERLGIDPVNAFERELPARDFDPGSYTMPASAWYDGPPAGVVIRNKRGGRAVLSHPDTTEPSAIDPDASTPDLAARLVTRARLEAATEAVERTGAVTFEALYEQVLEDVMRRHHRRLFEAEGDLDMRAFRTAVADRTRSFFDDR